MIPSDKAQFVKILTAVYELHGKSATESTVKLWFASLEPFELDEVSEALSHLMRTSKYLPKPAEVVDLISPKAWPTAAEAWALVPKDERETGAVCDEMQGAWAACMELMEAGDVIGARRAFEGAWDRIVGGAVSQGKRRPNWRLSIGWDEASREYGARRAFDKGLLTHDQVAGYIEHGEAIGLPDLRKSGRAGDVRHVSRLLGGAFGDGTAGDVSPGAGEVGQGKPTTDMDA